MVGGVGLGVTGPEAPMFRCSYVLPLLCPAPQLICPSDLKYCKFVNFYPIALLFNRHIWYAVSDAFQKLTILEQYKWHISPYKTRLFFAY